MRGGDSAFAVDPDLTASEAAIFWSPAIDPSVVVIVRGVRTPHETALLRAAIERADFVSEADARCRLLRVGAHLFPLFVSQGATLDDLLAATVAFDALLPDRLEAIARLWEALQHSPRSPLDLTTQRRSRMRQMLRVFDARRDGLSYRAIAETLFPQHHIDAMSWAGNALRETTIRLARDGIKLVNGGYRFLLRRKRKS